MVGSHEGDEMRYAGRQANELVAGSLGTSEGIELARKMKEIGRFDLVVAFYAEIDTLEVKLLRPWLYKKHPDVALAIEAKKRILG